MIWAFLLWVGLPFIGFMVGHTLKVYRGTIEGLRETTDAEAPKPGASVGDRQSPLDWVICIEEHPGGGKRQFVVSVRYMHLIHVSYVGSFIEVATFVADTMYKHRAELSPDGGFFRNDVGEWVPIELDEGISEFAVPGPDRENRPNVADYKMAPGEGRPVRFEGERFADDIGAHHVVRSEVATEGDELDVVRKRRKLRGM